MKTLKKNGNHVVSNVNSHDFYICLTNSYVFYFFISTYETTSFSIYWGDGEVTTRVVSTSNVYIEHRYSKLGVYGIVIEGDVSIIKLFTITKSGVGSLGRKFLKMNRLNYLRTSYENNINSGYENIKSSELQYLIIQRNSACVDINTIVDNSKLPFIVFRVTENTIMKDAIISKVVNPLLSELTISTEKKIIIDFSNVELTSLRYIHISLSNNESYIGILNFSKCKKLNSLNIWFMPKFKDNSIIIDENADLSACETVDIYGTYSVKCNVSINLNGKTLPLSPPTATFHSGVNSGAYGDITGLFPNPIRAQKIGIGESPLLKGDITNWRFDRSYNSLASLWYNNTIAGTSICGDISNLRIPYSGIRLNISRNKLVGINNFIRGIFEDRLLISTTTTTVINVWGNEEQAQGTYRQGKIYNNIIIHDLTESQISECAKEWSSREIVWWLVNALVNSTSTTKRYNFSITL